MDLKPYAELVEQMRDSQTKYFKERTASALMASKNLEKQVDEATDRILHPEKYHQIKMF